jgi:tetratricopeptide (TPR) repeat protein
MSKRKWALLAVLVWALAAAMGPACYGGQGASGPAGPDLSALARRARLAVGVLVTLDADGKPLSQGTAFFVRPDGVALTCHHVLEDAVSALVRMENGAHFPVEGRLAGDPVRDLALFKVAGKDLPTLPLGDSSTLAPAQRVVAITALEGLGSTVADGLVSAVRELPSGSVVQVSVPLSPGSSGGPIFDLSGKVVAVAAAVLTEGQALSFAIPINAAKPLLAQPGGLTPLAPAEQPADLEDWLRHRPPSALCASAFDLWLQGMDGDLNGRYEEAIRHLRAALALDPTLCQAHCCLGVVYGELGQREAELAEHKEAIRLKPDLAEAHLGLGRTYGKAGRYEQAIAELKEAIRLKADDAKAHYNLGVTYGKLGRHEEAIAEYKEAIRLKADYAFAHNNLGVNYDALGRHEEAIAECKQAVRLKPDYVDAHYNLGAAYGALGRHEEAIAEDKEAIRLKPDYAEAHVNLGLVYDALGRHEEAVAECKEAVRLKPDYADAHYNLGLAYSKLDRHEEAMAQYKEAIRLKPDDADAHSNLGLTYGNLGRYEQAIAELKEAVRLKPDDAKAHYGLGVAYLIRGDRSAALEEHRILKDLDPGLAEKLFALLYP